MSLLVALVGFAFLDSLDVLLVGVTAAIAYRARLSRRSPVPAGLSFIAGVFTATTTFGVLAVFGINFLTDLFDFTLTPAVRYRGELVIGIVLIVVAALPSDARKPPAWTDTIMARPAILALAGVAIGIVQAPTAIPYLAGLALITAQQPLPMAWPLIVLGYCTLALVPPLLIVFLAARTSPRARRQYLRLVRFLITYGPAIVRVVLAVLGLALIGDAALNFRELA